MNTQELKQYIDRVLGNNIRCLLPSYWWKRLFNQVADRIDDKQDILVSGKNIKTINGKDLLGEGDTNADIIINSVDELNALDLPAGSRASVVTGGPVLSSIRDCVESEIPTQWTRISGVKIDSFPVLPEGIDEIIIDFTSYGSRVHESYILVSDTIMGAVDKSTNNVFMFSSNGRNINQSAVDKFNKYLQSGDYRLVLYEGYIEECGDLIDSFMKFYIYHPTISDVYVKADSWEMLSKGGSIIVNSIDELNALNVQQGTIASVAISQGEGNFVNCYQSSEDELIENLESGTGKINEEYLNKLTKIYGISRIELPNEPFNETIETYLIHYAQDGNSYSPLLAVYSSDGTSSGTYMQIFDSKMSFFKDDGTLNEDAFTALSQCFQYPTYYLCTVGDGNLLSKVFIPTMDYSDIYIKESADSWTKYSKHTYVKSLEDRINIVQDTISSINNETQINNKIVSAAINDLNDKFKGIRLIYASEVKGNIFDTTTTVELTEEQKLYNLESVKLAIDGKAFLGIIIQGTIVYFTMYDQSSESLYTTMRGVDGVVMTVKAEFDGGNYIITIDVDYPDSELSSTSMASVQNKVITSEINKLNTKIAELESQLTALQNNQ